MKRPDLKDLTLKEKIAETAVSNPASDLATVPFGISWLVGAMRMQFVNMDFTPRDDLKMTPEESIEDIKKFNKIRKIPLLCAMDCMYGINAQFYEMPKIPSTSILGSANDENFAYELGKLKAMCLKKVGAMWCWGPEVDLSSRNSEISYGRQYSTEPEIIEKMTVAEMKGIQDMGVLATVKHFPGADEIEYRDAHTSHQKLHIKFEDWKKRQGKLFKKMFDEGVASVMMSHSSFPDYDKSKIKGKYLPASVSYKMITELVKGEMGFKGVVVTDAVKMKALSSMFGSIERVYIEAIKAGNDAVLGVGDNYIDVIYDAVKNGEIKEERIDDACRRVLDMKEKAGLFKDNPYDFDVTIEEINKKAKELGIKVAEKGITLEANKNNLLPKKDLKNVGIIVLSPDKNFPGLLKNNFCKSFEKRGINVNITRDLFSDEEIKKIAEENDLIIYVVARCGKYKYFGMEENESYNFILNYGEEKSMGVSFGDPYVYFDKLSILDTFINAYNLTDETAEAVVKAILGEIKIANNHAFNIIPENMREFE